MNAVASVLLQNAVIVAVAALLLLVVFRAVNVPARLESLLWLAVAVRLILPPLLPVSVPLPLADASFAESQRSAETDATSTPSVGAASGQAATSPGTPWTSRRAPTTETERSLKDDVESSRAGAAADALLAVWFGGAIVFLMLRCAHIGWWTRRRRVEQAPPELWSMVAEVAKDLRVRSPRVGIDLDLAAPVVTGVFRPRLLWPARLLDTLEPDRARMLIAHELAHIRHLDLWAGFVELVVGCVWWWYPGWYLVRGRFRDASERACDARVVSLYPSLRRQYAEGLLDVVAIISRPAPLPIPGFSGDRRHVGRRLREILSIQPGSWSPMIRPGAIVFVLLLTPAWMPAPPSAPDADSGAVAVETEQESARRVPVGGVPESARDRRVGEPADTALESSEQDADLSRRLRSSNADMRRRAVGTIGRERRFPLMPDIYPLAFDPAERVRQQVALSIGLAEPIDGIATLIELLTDENPGVRNSAAWALGEFEVDQLEREGAAEPLLERARDSDRRVRRQVAASLAITGIEEGTPVLLSLLDDESASVRATAVWGLSELRRLELTRELAELADDVDPAVRRNVARAMYLLPAAEWRPVLEQLVDDSDPDVRGTATLALRQYDLESSASGD